MRFEEFNPEDVPRSSKQVFYLDVVNLTGGDMLRLAALVARGAQPGPTIAVLGGVHGDEYEGPHAVRQVFAGLDPAQLSGTFVGVPETNVPAFAAANRSSPIDGLNLARVFPGSKAGSPTERIAYYVDNYVIARASFLIDLHSSGTRYAMATLIGYYAAEGDLGQKNRDAAYAFGAPVVWAHPNIAPGRSLSAATDRGIPSLYTESPAGGWLHKDVAALYARGVTNVMKHLGMLPGPLEREEPRFRLQGSGVVEEAMATGTAGFLLPEVKLLDRVKKGDLLGRVLGLAGEVLEELRADGDGVVVLMRTNPTVYAGDQAFIVTGESQ